MNCSYPEIVRRLCRPLTLQPTGEPPVLKPMSDIQGVLFDVYGTMFISGSGDVGVAQESAAGVGRDARAPGRGSSDVGVAQKSGRADALAEAWSASGYQGPNVPSAGVSCLLETIVQHQQQGRVQGIEYPEVDILEVWRDWSNELVGRGILDPAAAEVDLKQLAIEYEFRTNPCWPMPDLCETLTSLRDAGLVLGIVSNAQFYTLEMFRGLLGRSPEELGFDPELQFYSYRYRQAKPGIFLYRLAEDALAKRGLSAQNILYVGNDMLNDVCAAAKVGFRTALYAGDRRSLRLRSGDERVQGIRPDLVLRDLQTLASCILPSPTRAT